jgi:hypothetical protein
MSLDLWDRELPKLTSLVWQSADGINALLEAFLLLCHLVKRLR